jgi:hypothetical protein
MGPLSIEEVLAEEAGALKGAAPGQEVGDLRQQATAQATQTRRMKKDADIRGGADENPADVESRKAFYRSLNRLNRAALSLSGGGIRSATFCLGVIQALAAYDVVVESAPVDTEEKSREKSQQKSEEQSEGNFQDESKDGSGQEVRANVERKPENSLLGRFQFMSTVSGGGYIGSWLSAWRRREDFPGVWRDLIGRPDGPDVEPAELSWLRAYSNYLTPKAGLGSADTWTGVAIYLRNLILNWLVIIPLVCLALLGLQFLAAFFVGIARGEQAWMPVVTGLLGAGCLIKAQAFTTSHRPTRREPPDAQRSPHNIAQAVFLKNGLIWTLLSSMGIAIALASRSSILWIESNGRTATVLALALIGALIFALGWLLGRPVRPSLKDFWRWLLCGAVYGGLIGCGAILFTLLHPYSSTNSDVDLKLLAPMVFAVPWILTSQLAAEVVFVGLVSYEAESDSDREWLGRTDGWVMAAAIAWALTAALSIALGHYVQEAFSVLGKYFASLGGVSGLVTAFLGKSSKTSATSDAGQSTTSRIMNVVLALAGPVFMAVLIVLLSIGLDKLLLGVSFVRALDAQSTRHILSWLALGGIAAGAVGAVASKNVNINRFSLHAIYRNRLVRCYLGASRQKRNPDHFTGFDEGDNPCVHALWPPMASAEGQNTFGLFHLVNIALNDVETKRLAWQERKAEPFTVSPLHCGGANKGFRVSSEYGGKLKGGLTLGTAMAISGAAVSPNMGYHSSPSITLMLALFNVRLGWWLGNPGTQGEQSYQTEGPSFAINPLVEEAFGLTTDDRPYVYLSDGGHFDNLGLYEMVRRRCRFIVVVDAGCDPGFTFEDLGNAVRKIYIDLGIRVRFDELQSIKNRPPAATLGEERKRIPYYTIGVIDYTSADGSAEGCDDGIILYIKPAYHGTEGAGIVSYASAHPTFPHETTTDQWFTESQFESYRSLGLEIADTILHRRVTVRNGLTLHQLLQGLPATTRAVPGAASS